ncbi:hypothetical protein C8K30_101455 [Promicromonospora sp. AC04]|uniref:hypothetical protein n=1 Tax=Promicromonospora sp. AC04 TaxID=2135723 RepID=UPI000D39FAD6|nr:hypothetical protein [Promicromonospora sp. AC04]PUB31936.1 hypothetical protein C8K30_101455 [Promicromonospora sp. AC04]
MPSVDQFKNGRADHTVDRAFIGEAMIERAKSVIVVARRVDDDQAAQILLDAACTANISVRLAADQVMTALQADREEGCTHAALMRALGAVRPDDRPPDHDSLPPPRPAGQAA